MWTLKKGQPAFEVVDGPMAGRRFMPGREYAEVPAVEKNRFAKVKPAGPVKAVDKRQTSKAKESTKNA